MVYPHPKGQPNNFWSELTVKPWHMIEAALCRNHGDGQNFPKRLCLYSVRSEWTNVVEAQLNQ